MDNALERAHVATVGEIKCKCGSSGTFAFSKDIPPQLPAGFRQECQSVVCEKCGATLPTNSN